MAYITYQQYINLYGSCPIAEDTFPVYAELASDMVDSVTQYRIEKGGGISALPIFIQTLIQKATAAQVLYYTQIGLETVLSGQTGRSFTVGKVSVSGGSLASNNKKSGALLISPVVPAMLEQTGLMDRGVSVCSGQSHSPYWWIL